LLVERVAQVFHQVYERQHLLDYGFFSKGEKADFLDFKSQKNPKKIPKSQKNPKIPKKSQNRKAFFSL
jgi:hypothetical protein